MKQSNSPQSASSEGFLARCGELFRLDCCFLSSAVQPFAYVVANYACYNRDKKCGENFFHGIHLLSAGGLTACYTKAPNTVNTGRLFEYILYYMIANIFYLQ